MSPPDAAIIEVFADLWCPFAHVGLRAIEEQRARAGRADVAIHVRAWPLELVNGVQLDPTVTKEHADALRAQVAPTLFRGLDVDRFPASTLEALGLVNRAYRSDVRLGERASFGLRDALFEEGRDISDRTTLDDLAHDLDIVMPDESDHAAVLADWHEGQQRGVLGSPHFFCGDADAFCPTLDITKHLLTGMSVKRDTERLMAFLDHCFEQSPAAEHREE